MQLTKLGHACVRLEKDAAVLVIDPGMFTAADALDGADAVLVTHEHADHVVPERLVEAMERNPALQVATNAAVAARLGGVGERVRVVGQGDAFTLAGFDVEAHGEWHAVIHPDVPRVHNVGFVVDGRVFHPGDAFTLPERPVAVLLLPVHAPWSKVGEIIDYARAVAPERAFALHDGLLNDAGLSVVNRVLGAGGPGTGTDYARLAPGESVDIP